MSKERQSGNLKDFVVSKSLSSKKINIPDLKIKKEDDETVGQSSISWLGRVMELRPVKKAISWVAATVATVSMIPGSVVAETEDIALPDKEIKVTGEMPSQNISDDLSQYNTLKSGYEGPEVAALKQRMFELGYFKNNTVNEFFTDKTAEYVKKFEEVNGLPVDGIADPEMQSLFFSDSARKFDGTPVAVKVDTPESEETQVESEASMLVETVIKPETNLVVDVENNNAKLETLEEVEVNQRFNQFLANEGEYSDEYLKGRLFVPNKFCIPELGFTMVSFDHFFMFHAILLFHKNINGEEILALGLKNRKGERVITAVSWPVRDIIPLGYGVFASKADLQMNNTVLTRFHNEGVVGLFLDERMGRVLNLTMDLNPSTSAGRPSEEYAKRFISLFSKKTDINRSFFTGIWRPERKDMSDSAKAMFQSVKNEGSVLEIKNYSDFVSMTNRTEDLPFFTNFYYHEDF